MPFKDDPHLTTPPDDAVLWRYLSLTRFVDLLKRKSLWFSRMDQFDDPLEGTFTDMELKELANNPGASWLMSVGLPLPEVDAARTTYFINCWREGPHESMAMWDIYGKGGITVAIKSDVGRLKAALTRYEYGVYLARVQYISWDIATWPAREALHCFRKDRSYEHEAEVRAAFWFCKEGLFRDAATGIPLGVDLSRLVTDVVVGPREQEETAQLVEIILKRYELPIPVTVSNRLKRRS